MCPSRSGGGGGIEPTARGAEECAATGTARRDLWRAAGAEVECAAAGTARRDLWRAARPPPSSTLFARPLRSAAGGAREGGGSIESKEPSLLSDSSSGQILRAPVPAGCSVVLSREELARRRIDRADVSVPSPEEVDEESIASRADEVLRCELEGPRCSVPGEPSALNDSSSSRRILGVPGSAGCSVVLPYEACDELARRRPTRLPMYPIELGSRRWR